MLTKRVIPCLDVRNGRLTKGVKFVGNEDIGDPVETARQYYEAGADEIVFYDITASAEARGIFLDVVEKVASEIFTPFSVGGKIMTGCYGMNPTYCPYLIWNILTSLSLQYQELKEVMAIFGLRMPMSKIGFVLVKNLQKTE